jgi:hypothetical protein
MEETVVIRQNFCPDVRFQVSTHDSMLVSYILCWLLLAMAAIANGVLRETTYGKCLPELLAHQLSTAIAIVLTGLITWAFNVFRPIESFGQAALIGASWLAATIAFEFGFGHFVAGHSWRKLLADYNLFKGRVWLLFLLWIAFAPYVFYKYG